MKKDAWMLVAGLLFLGVAAFGSDMGLFSLAPNLLETKNFRIGGCTTPSMNPYDPSVARGDDYSVAVSVTRATHSIATSNLQYAVTVDDNWDVNGIPNSYESVKPNYCTGNCAGLCNTQASIDFTFTVTDLPKFSMKTNQCSVLNTELVFAETFAGGQVISEASLAAPLKKFCSSLPAVVTNANTQGTYTDLAVYYALAKGQVVTVPASTTYTLFWVTDQSPQLAYQCSTNFYYDSDVKQCKPSNAFAYFCSGTFIDGKCVVQPEVFCPLGTDYDATGNKCVATTAIIDCTASGVVGAVWVSEKNACVYQPPLQTLQGVVQYQCPDGSWLSDAVSGTCTQDGVLVSICTQGGNWNGSNCVKELVPETRVPIAQYDCSQYDTLSGNAQYNSATGLCDVAPDKSPSANTVKVEVTPAWVWYVVGGAALLAVFVIARQKKVI